MAVFVDPGRLARMQMNLVAEENRGARRLNADSRVEHLDLALLVGLKAAQRSCAVRLDSELKYDRGTTSACVIN